jgi:3-phenylpropionate/trans-cinnamate dioxygenase ferredoxin subunit
MAQVAIGPLVAFPDRRAVAVDIGGRRLAVVRCDDRVFAIDDRCSHRGFPLHDGTVDQLTIRCRTHGACFDLHTGGVLCGPARRAIRTYPAEVRDGEVLVDLP